MHLLGVEFEFVRKGGPNSEVDWFFYHDVYNKF